MKKNKINEENNYAIKNTYVVPRPKEITEEEKNENGLNNTKINDKYFFTHIF